MTRRRGVAAILAVGTLAACGRSDPLPWRAARLESLVDGSRIEKTVEKLARVPHRAGTPAQRAVVAAVAEILRANGLETAVAEQTVNLPEPVEASLAVEGPAGRAFDLVERASSIRFRSTPFWRCAPWCGFPVSAATAASSSRL